MNVLIWHVHGSWLNAFVQGPHRYVVPVVPDRSADGRGRARTWTWPERVVERTPDELVAEPIDVVVLQRPQDEQLARRWLGRRPGADLPAVYVEHNVPQGRIDGMRHELADRRDLVLVHVSHFNALFWDSGSAPTVVIEHGVVDPGARYTGELPAAAVVVNEPCRRGRVTGTDLLAPLARRVPVDVFGMRVVELPPMEGLAVHEDLPQDELHREIARRTAYVHPYRWTSLGLALIEAMLLAMPVVALATTEVPDVVPADAGVVSTQPSVLARGIERFLWDPADAQETGRRARDAALARFGLDRFLADWDRLLEEVTR